MPNRPPGLIDAAPWSSATPKPGINRPERPFTPPRETAPCQGCRHLFTRYADGGPGRPRCAQGVDYGQPGCIRAPSRPHA